MSAARRDGGEGDPLTHHVPNQGGIDDFSCRRIRVKVAPSASVLVARSLDHVSQFIFLQKFGERPSPSKSLQPVEVERCVTRGCLGKGLAQKNSFLSHRAKQHVHRGEVRGLAVAQGALVQCPGGETFGNCDETWEIDSAKSEKCCRQTTANHDTSA